MRTRLFIFLGVVALLGFYTGEKAAEAFPLHPFAAMAIAILFIAFYVGWMLAYRRGILLEDLIWTRMLAWIASIEMALWSTFLVNAVIANFVTLFLQGIGRGATLLHVLPILTAGVSVLIAALGMGQAIAGPRVVPVSVPVRDLHQDLRGLRIVQITDIHVGATIHRRYIERIVDQVLALKPDLIAVTGDLADGTPERLAPHVAPLARLQAPLGVYYVTGNHEYYWGAEGWITKAEELGFIPLINANRIISHQGAKILLSGITDESGGSYIQGHSPDITQAAAAESKVDFRLLLAHRPDGVPAAELAGFDLQLSGHTHGGQFFPASLFIPLFHRYYRGMRRHGKMWIYVSPGTGYWGPIQRFAVPSEITLLTLTTP